MPGLIYREQNGDLFSAKSDFSLCHCVAADLRMGKGIAVKFRNKFGQLLTLQRQKVQPGGVAVLQDQQRYVYYLVTKQTSWGKPTYELLHSSLHAIVTAPVATNKNFCCLFWCTKSKLIVRKQLSDNQARTQTDRQSAKF